jgi:predicted RecA/RadA family phage recombinase
MKNYVQAGDVVTLSAPRDVVSGELVAVGRVVGVAQAGAKSGEPVALVRRGVFSDLVKKSGQSWSVGDVLYYDATAKKLTNVEAETVFAVGAAMAQAESTATVGTVLLDGAVR